MPVVYSHHALSGDGRAAKAFVGSTEDQKWINIQTSTFTRWVNEQLARKGLSICDLAEDLMDGVSLLTLVEVLQNRRSQGKVYRNSPNEIQMLHNVQLALDAMHDDGVRLVNIGNHDIVEGNLKLILGMIWCLILRYQIGGRTKVPPRKLMLAWLKAILPSFNVTNFSRDWNDGTALSALIDYCQPGLLAEWRTLDRRKGLENCQYAMETARDAFGVPMVLTPEDLASPNLDELSGMTYLSYFMREGSPGYYATLCQFKRLVPDCNNFMTDWLSGIVLCNAVYNLGASVPNWPNLPTDAHFHVRNQQLGILGAQQLGCECILSAAEMADPEIQHLGRMALAAKLCGVKPMQRRETIPTQEFRERIRIMNEPNKSYAIAEKVNLELLCLDRTLSVSELAVDVESPAGESIPMQLKRTAKGCVISFVVLEEGLYVVRVYSGAEELASVPIRAIAAASGATSHSILSLQQPRFLTTAMPQRGEQVLSPNVATTGLSSSQPPHQLHSNKVSFSGLSEPCAVGSIVEVVINAHGASEGQVIVEAFAPSGRIFKCPVHQKGITYTATFTPNEVGEWKIAIYYDSEHIKGSPFLCFCYDANLVQVYGLDVGVVGQELKFNVNTSTAGSGDLKVNVLHHGRSIPCHIDRQGVGLHRVQFTPDGAGQYKIHIYFNNMEVKGSPFILDIVDASSVSVYGENLRMASVGKLSTFMIHAVGADSKDLTVTIQAPSGKKKRARIVPIGDAAYRVEWKPVEAGEHYIDVRLYNQSVRDSPFTCNVGDPELVTVRNMPAQIRHTELGEQHTFEIDASAAGSGNLEIMINNGRVPCRVKDLGGRCYLAAFIPSQPITHVVEMRFNGDAVKGSPWRIEVVLPKSDGSIVEQSLSQSIGNGALPLGTAGGNFMIQPLPFGSSGAQLAYLPPNFFAASQATAPGGQIVSPIATSSLASTTITSAQQSSVQQQQKFATTTMTSEVSREYSTLTTPVDIQGVGLTQCCVGKVSSFEIGGKNLRSDDIEVKLISPVGKITPCNIIVARTGNFRCEYVPTEVGAYTAHVSIQGREIDGSPFHINGFSPQKIFINPIPGGTVGRPVQFVVDANTAGKGELEISVNQGRVPNNVQMQGTGKCLVTFIPEIPGTYIVDVTFNGELARGCPLRVEVGDHVSVSPSGALGAPAHADSGIAPSRSPYRGLGLAATAGRETDSSQRQQPSTLGALGPTRYTYTSTSPLREINEEPDSKPPLKRTAYDRGFSAGAESPLKSLYQPTATSPPMERPFRNTYQSSLQSGDFATAAPSSRGPIPPPPPPLPQSTTERSYVIHKSMASALPEEDLSTLHTKTYRADFDYSSDRRGEIPSSAPAALQHERPFFAVTTASSQRPQDRQSVDSSLPAEPLRGNENQVSRVVRELERNGHALGLQKQQQPTLLSESSAKPMTLHEERIDDAKPLRPYASESKQRTQPMDARQISLEAESPLYAQIREDNGDRRETTTKKAESPLYDEVPAEPSTQPPAVVRMSTATTQVFEQQSNLLEDRSKPPEKLRSTTDVGLTQELSSVPPPVPASSGRLSEQRLVEEDRQHIPEHRVEKLVPVAATEKEFSEFEILGPEKGIVRAERSCVIELLHPPHLSLSRENLDATVITPSKSRICLSVQQRQPGRTALEFRPQEIGTHKLSISLNGQPIHDTPISIKVYDPEQIFVDNIDGGVVNSTAKFTVDASNAGFGSLEIAIKDEAHVIVPSKVTQAAAQTAKFIVAFMPKEKGKYAIHVSFNGDPLSGSPFMCPIRDEIAESAAAAVEQPSQVEPAASEENWAEIPKESKPPKLIAVGTNTSFQVKSNNPELLRINVRSPSSKLLKTSIMEIGTNSTYQIEFVPEQVGDHVVDVRIADMHANGSPFTCRVYDAKRIKVGEVPHGFLGKPVHFVVDASEAGVGNLEVAVNEGRIPSMAQSLGQHRYDISFIPREEKDHTIGVKFNNEPVPGSPFTCHVITANQVVASGPGLERIPAGKPAEFVVDPQGAPPADIDIAVKDPTGKELEVNISEDPSGSYVVEYVPEIVGNHSIDVLYANTPIQNSPFTAKVYDSSRVKLYNVEGNMLGKPTSFIIDASKAGAGNMEIIVSVESHNVPNFVQAEGGARFRVSFTPQEPKPHLISVKFNGEPVPGSPVECLIIDSSQCVAMGNGLKQSALGKVAAFVVDSHGAGQAECNVIVIDPHGGAVPVKCFQQKDGNFRVEYSPTLTGEHKIDITFADIPIEGSPFICDVVDPKQITFGEIRNCIISQESAILVNHRDAGKGELKVTLIDPKGDTLPYKLVQLSSGDEEIRFVPTKIGKHQLQVQFAGFEVPNTPVYFTADEPGKPSAHGDGLQRALTQEPAAFIVEAKKTKGDLKVEIFGPTTKLKPTIEKLENHWRVSYVPTEGGKHEIRVLWNGKELSGSPYYATVSDPSRVKFAVLDQDSKGRIRLKAGNEKILYVDSKDAGPGSLRSEVRGPSGKVSVTVEEKSDGRYKLAFTPVVEGDHFVYLFWSDCPVPGTPANAWAEASDEKVDARRVVLKGDGLREARIRTEAEFTIDGTDAGPGRPTATLVGQKVDIPVSLTHLGNNIWKAAYTAVVSGKYHLDVKWGDESVAGSPFKVSVEAEGDSSKVIVTGEGLKMGIIGKDIKSFIDTRRAGPGTLTAQCTGPTQPAYCELYDHRDGTFTLNIKPQETGKHALIVKYSADHVHGSPFSLFISNPPEPNKVKVYGPGIEHGILSKFKSNFIVETKGAGAGQLTVRVRGPKGAFNVEMQREHKHDRTIHCKYDPREPGDYQIEVKWAGEHVPGSPFGVMIVDTQVELDRVLSGQPLALSPMHPPFMPPGWMGPPPPGMLMPPPMPGPPPPGAMIPIHHHPALPPPPQMRVSPGPGFGPPRAYHPYGSNSIYNTGSTKHWIASSGDY